MAQPIPAPAPTAAQFSNPLPIIDPHYCVPYPVDLSVVKKVITILDGDFVVTDINGTVIFKVKRALITLHDHRILRDPAGNPIVTLQQKKMCIHHRWNVYRGESKDRSDLIFTVKRSEMIQLKAKLHVFLANNTKEEICDFIVEGSWAEKTCVIYTGDRTHIVAQMHKEIGIQSVVTGKDNYSVTVQPNFDYAFIVALIVILDDMNFISEMSELVINAGMNMAGLPSTSDIVGK